MSNITKINNEIIARKKNYRLWIKYQTIHSLKAPRLIMLHLWKITIKGRTCFEPMNLKRKTKKKLMRDVHVGDKVVSKLTKSRTKTNVFGILSKSMIFFP